MITIMIILMIIMILAAMVRGTPPLTLYNSSSTKIRPGITTRVASHRNESTTMLVHIFLFVHTEILSGNQFWGTPFPI